MAVPGEGLRPRPDRLDARAGAHDDLVISRLVGLAEASLVRAEALLTRSME